MAEGSRRCPPRHERGQAVCIWGLNSIFRSTKRSVDIKRESKHPVGAGSSSNQAGLIENRESREDAGKGKMAVPKSDVSITTLKELMEQERIEEEGSRNQKSDVSITTLKELMEQERIEEEGSRNHPNSEANSKPDQSKGHKPLNFFRRRCRSMESCPWGGEKDVESTNNIGGPTGAQSPESNRMVSSPQSRNTSRFSFTEIKRKLRNAMGKERQGVSPDKHQNGNNGEKGSATQSEMIKNDNNSDDNLKSLDIDYVISIRDDQECSLEVESFTQDATVPEVKSLPSIVGEIEEMTDSKPQEEEISKASSNLIHADFDTGEEDNSENFPQFFNEFSPCFESPLLGEGQILSTSAVPVSSEVEDFDSGCAIEKMERPSPVSVLEPTFTDDNICPASIISQPVGKEGCIHFEELSDQGICTRISSEDEESAFEYVEAVLLGSGLNWDEFLVRWLSTYEILDSSLFDEIELFSSRPRYDQKFLFDCANTALKEVCDIYFGCYSRVSCVKLNTQPPPKGMDLIQEIWQRVKRLLLQHPHPYSVDHFVKTDLVRSRNWMNLQSDIELIVSEMEETILLELVEEIVPSFVEDTFELPMLDAESNASEIEESDERRL